MIWNIKNYKYVGNVSKDEPEDTLPRTCSRGIVINERSGESSPCGPLCLVKPKTEPSTDDGCVKIEPGTGDALAYVKKEPSWSAPRHYVKTTLNAEEAGDPEEFPGLKKVAEASFNEVPPVDPDFTLIWSASEHRRLEEERKRRLLEEEQQLFNQAARRRRATRVDQGAGLSRRFDDGAGTSAAAGNDDDNDDGGDYTVFYRHFGM